MYNNIVYSSKIDRHTDKINGNTYSLYIYIYKQINNNISKRKQRREVILVTLLSTSLYGTFGENLGIEQHKLDLVG